ncbi:hypothetical protein [Pseudogulbenkiania ferrooxidans]|uniref:hypothetical protein n=1 Tax=Pseudogulbenkiania ferrooxidans TaxID=549169 RepID=UPI0012693E05|nr:hypothetical protein [Pseudogulbenkiania ferrooxidans]
METPPIACPCCGDDLYKTQPISGPYRSKIEGPEFRQDDQGLFMVCPNCQCRIEFTGIGQISLSPTQTCIKHVEK